MPKFTNISQHLIHTHMGTMMLPGMPMDLSDEESNNDQFQDMVTAGDIVAGELTPEQKEQQEQRRSGQTDEQQRAGGPTKADVMGQR